MKKEEQKREEELRQELLDGLDSMAETTDGEILDLIDDMVMREGKQRGLTLSSMEQLRRGLFCSVRRLDVLQDLLDDPDITEIMVNGYQNIFYEKNGRIRRWSRSFPSRTRLEDVIQQIAGWCNRVVNEQRPIVDARLPDGSRVNVVLNPVSIDGPAVTIRRFPEEPITMDRLVKFGSLTNEAASFLKELVEARYSILVGGGTSTGKTTFLNALSSFIPSTERVVTIEDNAELQIQGVDNLVRLEARSANLEGSHEITIRDLIITALRMRPDAPHNEKVNFRAKEKAPPRPRCRISRRSGRSRSVPCQRRNPDRRSDGVFFLLFPFPKQPQPSAPDRQPEPPQSSAGVRRAPRRAFPFQR